ncbi:MAG: MGMT family protein [Actinobacteria bacterium]|nr:MGMT family protein [Actinomycetota bacterium]
MKISFPFMQYWLNVDWVKDLIISSSFSKEPQFQVCNEKLLDELGKKIFSDISYYQETGFFDCLQYRVDMDCYSDFFRRVYEELRRVKSGETITYKKLAEMVGNPNASRAVGLAMKRNKHNLFIPCHRVVGSSSIGGWSGLKGLKEKLLELERRIFVT